MSNNCRQRSTAVGENVSRHTQRFRRSARCQHCPDSVLSACVCMCKDWLVCVCTRRLMCVHGSASLCMRIPVRVSTCMCATDWQNLWLCWPFRVLACPPPNADTGRACWEQVGSRRPTTYVQCLYNHGTMVLASRAVGLSHIQQHATLNHCSGELTKII